MVSDRGLAVLRAIVHDYVATREPVGSKSIVERYDFGVSAATIRNDMAQLEEEELITAPHTSSGRMPTDKGYRVFVDQLTQLRPLSAAERRAIEAFLGESSDLDEALNRTVRLLAQLTNQLAIVQYPHFGSARIQHIELVPLSVGRVLCVLIADSGHIEQRVVEVSEYEEASLGELRAKINVAVAGLSVVDAAQRLHTEDLGAGNRSLATIIANNVSQLAQAQRHDRLLVSGAANLVRTEQDFSGNIFNVMDAIEEQVVLLRLFNEVASDGQGPQGQNIAVSIGRENASFGLGDASVVSSGFSVSGQETSRIGVLGPTRMDYSHSIVAVRAVARYLSRLLGES